MLGLLRKYQKALFFFITFIIIVSFTFFGSSHTQSVSHGDEAIAQTLSGSNIRKREVEKIKAFIRWDIHDQEQGENLLGGNFFNAGILKKHFFESGIASLILYHYKPYFADDYAALHNKEKRFVPYQHPYLGNIQVVNIWRDFSPRLLYSYQKLIKADDPLSIEAIDARIQCYLQEKSFHQDSLKRFIYFEESRQAKDPKLRDSYLARRDLALFNYQNVEDWFGTKFMDLAAQLILQLADQAKQKGYQVSNQEVEAYLQAHLQKNYQQLSSYLEKQQVTPENLMMAQAQRLGLSLGDIKAVAKEVLLFSRLMQELSLAPLESPFTLFEYQKFSKQKIKADRYSLSPEFHLKTLQDIVQFEVYKELLAKEVFLGVIKSFKKPEEVQQSFMVQRSFEVKVQSVKKTMLASRYSLKQTWDWQLEDPSHWSMIQKDFPSLNLPNLTSREEKFQSLASLSQQDREKIDVYSRKQLLDAEADWLQEAMNLSPSIEKTLVFEGEGQSFSLPGIRNPKEMLKALETLEKGMQLKAYTQDDEHYYHFELVQKTGPRLLSFKEAKENAQFNKYIQTILQKTYEGDTGLQKHPFEKALPQIVEKRFASSIASLEKSLADKGIDKEFPQKFSVSFLSRHYFAPLLFYAKERLENKQALPTFLLEPSPFAALKTSLDLGYEDPQTKPLLRINSQSWSSLIFPLEGDTHFFYLHEVVAGQYEEVDELLEMQKYLGDELSIFYLHEFLRQLEVGIHLAL